MTYLFIVIFVLCGPACALCAPANAAFPTVTPVAQKARDSLRREIIEAELNSEREVLAAVRKVLPVSPSEDQRAELHRHDENVESLKRELARLRGGAVEAVRLAAHTAPAMAPEPAPFWDVYRRVRAESVPKTPISRAAVKESSH